MSRKKPPPPNHNSIAVIWKVYGGKLLFLMFDSLQLKREYGGDNPQFKLPGGRSKNQETPLETLIREVYDETGLTFIDKSKVVQIHEDRILWHTKYGFLTPFENCTGTLRVLPMTERNSRIGRPDWFPSDIALRIVFRGKHGTHHKVLSEACRILVEQHALDPKVVYGE